MATITQNITIDVARANVFDAVIGKQYDEDSRFLKCSITQEGEPLTIPSGSSIAINAKRPDGTMGSFAGTRGADGTAIVPISSWILEQNGMVNLSVSIVGSGGEKLTSCTFYLNVQEAEGEGYILVYTAPSSVATGTYYITLGGVSYQFDLTTALATGDKIYFSSTYATGKTVDGSDGSTIETLTLTEGTSGTELVGSDVINFLASFMGQIAQTAWIPSEPAADGIYLLNRANGVWTWGEMLTAADWKASWQSIQLCVRLGLAPYYFPVGTEFSVKKTIGGVDVIFPFRVVGFDTIAVADKPRAHTMVLESKYVYGTSSAYKSLAFDAIEALYYAESGLAAGSYFFTVKNQSWYAADNDVPYYFTLTNAVPAGAQLVLNMTYNQSLEGKKINVYASASATTASETATLSSTPIAGAINLGEPDGQTANMNFMHRAIFGSNNYAQSNVRQWLNAAGEVNTYYTAQTKFDRPNWNLIGSDTAYAGFAHGFGDDFLNAVKPAVVPYRTNDVYEVDSLDGTVQAKSTVYNVRDKFFLLSRPEIYGSWDSSSLKDGEQLDYYVGLTNAERIKYDSFGSARSAWLRSPDPSYGNHVRGVSTDGSLGNGIAYYGYGAAVACIIA